MQVTPQPDADIVGGRYELLEPIGEGNFSITYRGRDVTLGRTIAVKMLRPQYAADPASVSRFEREARVAASVAHPNVVDVYDFGRHHDTFFIVMQFVPGRDLKHELDERGPLPPDEAARITRQILRGLGAIHAAGIVHRDIKPQNVLCGRDAVARVTDFGIALGPLNDSLTSHGTTVGTASYMAPEQARGGAVSAATDLYAVGVVLFELLTNRLPFEADNPMAVMLAHLQSEPPAPSAVAPHVHVPVALELIIKRALAKNPADRYAGADEMAAALDAAVAGTAAGTAHGPFYSPLAAATTQLPIVDGDDDGDRPFEGWPTPRAATARAAAPTPVPPPLPTRRRRRELGWLGPVAVFVLALAALGAIVASGGLFGGNDGNDPPGTQVAGAAGGETGTPTVDTGGAGGIVATLPTATTAPPPTATATVPPSPTATATASPTPPPTSVPPTATTVPPTPTPVPPTNTPVPPTATNTPAPTSTPEPVVTPPILPSEGTTAQALRSTSGQGAAGGALPELSFDVGDWQGGYNGDNGWYGGPWVALYGAGSPWSRASLQFDLDAPPTGDVFLAVVGLGDEYGTDFPIAFEVNGRRSDATTAPFSHWDPAQHGANGQSAPWSTSRFRLPAAAFAAGRNEVAIVSFYPGNAAAGDDNARYVLLRDATITFDGGDGDGEDD